MALTSALLPILLQGCSFVDSRQGVYVAPIATGAPGWIGMPAGVTVWSPDGVRIAWGTEEGLMVKSLKTGESSVFKNIRVAGRPAWSPDGHAIALIDRATASLVIVSADSGHPLVTMSIADENARPALGAIPSVGGPAWSPDGERLAFACWDGAGDEVCVVNADGSSRRVVTKLESTPILPDRANAASEPAMSNVGPPAWSPDGSMFAVAAYPERRGATAGVFVIDVDRGSSRRISKLLPNSEIRWTQEGASLIFSAVAKGRSDAWLVSEQTLSMENLTEKLPKGGASPAISPDGRSMAIASDGAILVITASNEPLQIELLRLRAAYPSWSPTGSEIAFTAFEDPIQTYD